MVVQVFLRAWASSAPRASRPTRGSAGCIHTAAIVVFLLALLGPRTGRAIGLSFGLLVLMTIQIMLVNARDDTPYLAALHPMLALLVLGLAFHIGMPLGQPTTGSVRSSLSSLSVCCISAVTCS